MAYMLLYLQILIPKLYIEPISRRSHIVLIHIAQSSKLSIIPAHGTAGELGGASSGARHLLDEHSEDIESLARADRFLYEISKWVSFELLSRGNLL